MNIELITRDSKNAIRYFKYCVDENKDSYTIRRLGGLFGGKEQTYPPLTISQGKAKRTVKEQMELELNSLLVKQLSKGYKNLSDFTTKLLSELSYDEIDYFFPEDVTDSEGNIKPMLAKDPGKAKDKLFNRHWFASTKLDGQSRPSINPLNSVNPEMGIPSRA